MNYVTANEQDGVEIIAILLPCARGGQKWLSLGHNVRVI